MPRKTGNKRQPYRKLTEKQIVEFRTHYLYSGSAEASAHELDIPPRTARDLAKKIRETDPNFAADRRQLQEDALERLVSMRMSIAERATKRYLTGIDVGGMQEKVSDHGKLVMEAEKNAQRLALVQAGNGNHASLAFDVTVRRIGQEDSSNASNGASDDGGTEDAA